MMAMAPSPIVTTPQQLVHLIVVLIASSVAALQSSMKREAAVRYRVVVGRAGDGDAGGAGRGARGPGLSAGEALVSSHHVISAGEAVSALLIVSSHHEYCAQCWRSFSASCGSLSCVAMWVFRSAVSEFTLQL